MKRFIYLIALLFFVGLDQVTKYLARASFMDGDSFVIIPKTLKLIYHENDGAAWGIFSGKPAFLICLTIVLATGITYIFFKIPEDKKYIPMKIICAMVVAGAIGNNLIDRVLHGYVIDFIYFELIDFPVFNVADIFIVIGVILMAFLTLLKYKDEDFEFLKIKKKEQEK